MKKESSKALCAARTDGWTDISIPKAPDEAKNLFQMAEALKALDKMDVDKDGKVSYPEFLLALKFN